MYESDQLFHFPPTAAGSKNKLKWFILSAYICKYRKNLSVLRNSHSPHIVISLVYVVDKWTMLGICLRSFLVSYSSCRTYLACSIWLKEKQQFFKQKSNISGEEEPHSGPAAPWMHWGEHSYQAARGETTAGVRCTSPVWTQSCSSFRFPSRSRRQSPSAWRSSL